MISQLRIFSFQNLFVLIVNVTVKRYAPFANQYLIADDIESLLNE